MTGQSTPCSTEKFKPTPPRIWSPPTGCTIVEEKEYVDSDYRSLYYRYFSRRLQPTSRNLKRKLFFQKSEDGKFVCLGATLSTVERDNTYKQIQSIHTISGEWYVLASKSKMHVYGQHVSCERFLHIKQDVDHSVCAHAALWACNTYFAERYPIYKKITIGEFAEIYDKITWERSYPRHGMNIMHMCAILKKIGFFPKPYHSKELSEIKKWLDIYLESGFPILLTLTRGNGVGHVVNIIGHSAVCDHSLLGDKAGELIYANRFEYLVVDDNHDPYQVLKINNSHLAYGMTKDEDNNRVSLYEGATGLVVPLPEKVNILAEHVLGFLEEARSQKKAIEWPDAIDSKQLDHIISSPDYVIRPFLTSSSGYQQYLLELISSNELTSQQVCLLKKQVTDVEWPHFVWVIEYSDRNQGAVVAHILIDSTASSVDFHEYVMGILVNKNAHFRVCAEDHIFVGELSVYKHNLKRVENRKHLGEDLDGQR